MIVKATIEERHFARLADVPRATRQDWAKARLTGGQTPPYRWQALAEVVALRELRLRLELVDVRVVWPQLKSSVSAWRAGEPARALIDLIELSALWCPRGPSALELLAEGRPVMQVDLEPALSVAHRGFGLAATAQATAGRVADDLAARRTARRPKRTSS